MLPFAALFSYILLHQITRCLYKSPNFTTLLYPILSYVALHTPNSLYPTLPILIPSAIILLPPPWSYPYSSPLPSPTPLYLPHPLAPRPAPASPPPGGLRHAPAPCLGATGASAHSKPRGNSNDGGRGCNGADRIENDGRELRIITG